MQLLDGWNSFRLQSEIVMAGGLHQEIIWNELKRNNRQGGEARGLEKLVSIRHVVTVFDLPIEVDDSCFGKPFFRLSCSHSNFEL